MARPHHNLVTLPLALWKAKGTLERQMISPINNVCDFISSLTVPGKRVALSAEAVAEALKMTAQEFSTFALNRAKALGHVSADAYLDEAIEDVVRVLSAAGDFTHDVNLSLLWLRTDALSDFRNLTPMQVIERGEVDALINYLESIDAGPAG